ncbi:MAG: hypothetical protein ACKOOC_10935, partial [Cyanobium sp.]
MGVITLVAAGTAMGSAALGADNPSPPAAPQTPPASTEPTQPPGAPAVPAGQGSSPTPKDSPKPAKTEVGEPLKPPPLAEEPVRIWQPEGMGEPTPRTVP